jgi:hypothetical protein
MTGDSQRVGALARPFSAWESVHMDADDDDAYRTEEQKEWAAWSAHGYRKLYQPRSVRRLFFLLTVLFIALLLTVFLLAAHGRVL